MPIYYTTTSSTSNPYAGTYWSTSTATDCSGYTRVTFKKSEAEYLKYWTEHWFNSLKEPQISEDDILKLIEGDE